MKWGTEWPEKHDLSSLRLLGTVGEPISPEAWIWYQKNIGGGFNLRGFSATSQLRDGFYRLGRYGQSNVDRLEIIRGPNAAIYGRAVVSAAGDRCPRRRPG